MKKLALIICLFSLISLDSKSKVTASENNVVLGYNWASMDLYYAPELYLGAKGSESFGLGFDFNFKKDTSNLYYGFGFAFESPEEHDDLNYLYGRILSHFIAEILSIIKPGNLN